MLLFNAYCRKCFFTCYNPNQLKQDFMKCINYAVKGGGFLTCSSRDNEFGDFPLYKKQKCTVAQLSTKSAEPQCGWQLGLDRTILPESVWVLGLDVIINTKGNLVDPKGSNLCGRVTFTHTLVGHQQQSQLSSLSIHPLFCA